jgi:hypothetical protein
VGYLPQAEPRKLDTSSRGNTKRGFNDHRRFAPDSTAKVRSPIPRIGARDSSSGQIVSVHGGFLDCPFLGRCYA